MPSATIKSGEGVPPPEVLPAMGTADDPVVFGDPQELLLCYEIAPSSGGGFAILAFNDVVHCEMNPWNVPEGLHEAKYPFRSWDFTEVLGSDLNGRWDSKYVPMRFWTISSNDFMLEIVFHKVQLVSEEHGAVSMREALLNYAIRAGKTWRYSGEEAETSGEPSSRRLSQQRHCSDSLTGVPAPFVLNGDP